MQQAALGRSRGSEQAAASLVRYCSLGPADFDRIRKRVCLVMETAPSAMQSLYGFSFSWLLHRKPETASVAEKGLGSTTRMSHPACFVFPPNLFSKHFWNVSLKTETLKRFLRPESLCFLAFLHPLLAAGRQAFKHFQFQFFDASRRAKVRIWI